MSVAVTLPLRGQAALRLFIAQVSSQSSPLYGRYLTPQQFAATYAPSSQQVEIVASYLTSQALQVDQISANNEVIDARGTAAAMEGAFGTTLGRYHDAALGRDYYANDGPVSVPAAIAPLIVAVAGLNNHYLRHHSAPTPHVGGGPAGGYTPVQLKAAYDINPLATAGYTGGNQHVGLFELDVFNQNNINAYDTNYSLGSPAPSLVAVDGGSTAAGGEIEVELDIEVIQAIAPAANITVWEGPNSDQGVIDTYNSMVMSDTTSTNSTSWGLCEALSSLSVMTSEDNIFQQAAAQGQSFFAASGDKGAFDCGGHPLRLGVDNPADDPYMTGTGGTTLNLNSDNTYSSESAWSGSGGGLSAVFAKPSWQTGPGVQNQYSNGKRQVPDVATDADPTTGISIYTTYNGQTGWFEVGGTSAAAPSWAAFAALYNEDASANSRSRLGFANPVLYTLASGSQTFPAFHDVTTGNNQYYSATSGWDYPTGWGTYDAYNLARDLINAETHVDCLLFSSGTTGQTSCPTGVTLTNSTNLVLSTNGGGLNITCTFWDSTLSPTFATLQGLGPTHIQIPQFNDLGNMSDSNSSFGSGATVTYTANTVTDTSKAFAVSFMGKTIQSKFSTGVVASVSGSTLTLNSNWSPATPVNGDPYQVAPCTDSLSGHDQFVAVNGWSLTFLDAADDEGSAEGSGTTGDALNLMVPVTGVVIYQAGASCTITLNPSGPGKYAVTAGYDDNTVLTVNGSGNSGAIPISVSGSGSCPSGATAATWTGSSVFSQTIRDG